MAHNRTAHYSAPYKRNNLMSLHQYAASADFPSLGTWDRAKSDDLYVVKGTVGRSKPICVTVVGVISSDKMHLEPHGNYDPNYMSQEQIGKKAKLQFVISNPAHDPEFSADYQAAIKRFRAIQDEVAASPSRREHFLESNNMKLNFPLFEPKTAEEQALTSAEREDGTYTSDMDVSEGEEDEDKSVTNKREPLIYKVNQEYQEAWAEAGKAFHNNFMQVYGPDEMLIDYRTFSRHLVSGTTVVVSFILRHFAIRDRGTNQVSSDTYSAIVQNVSILRPAERKIRISPLSTPRRRPLPVSQQPSRGILKQSADTFAPIRPGNLLPSTPSTKARSDASSPDKVHETVTATSNAFSSSPVLEERSSAVPSLDAIDKGAISPELIAKLIPYLLEALKNPAFLVSDLLNRVMVTETSVGVEAPPISVEGSGSDISAQDTLPVEASPSNTGSESTLSSASSDPDENPLDPEVSSWIDVSPAEAAHEGTIANEMTSEESSLPPVAAVTLIGRRRNPASKATVASNAKVNGSADAPSERQESKKRKL